MQLAAIPPLPAARGLNIASGGVEVAWQPKGIACCLVGARNFKEVAGECAGRHPSRWTGVLCST